MSLVRSLSLYVGFAATGVCCALVGVLLPTLLVEWHLDDHAAGLIFLMIWLGGSLGALLVLNALRTSIVVGCASTAITCAGLAYFGRERSALLMLLYGAAIGLTMTSISLLCQQVQTCARSLALVRLNLVWAVGACVCPLLVAHALRWGGTRGTFKLVSLVFTTLAFLSLVVISRNERLIRGKRFIYPTWTIFREVPMAYILTTILATGIEASGGSWLATYAHRSQPGALFTIAAPTCLWAGLLFSRFFGSFAKIEFQMRRWILVFLTLVFLSTVALVAAVHGAGLLVASLLLGFGLGPLYPIFLARVLAIHQGGAIFFLAGISSAIMPWMTGVLSSRFRSLNAGLLVAATGALALLLLEARSRRVFMATPQTPC